MKRITFIKSLAFLSLFSCITSCSNGKATLLFEASKNLNLSSGALETESFQKLIAGAKTFSAKLSEELLKDYQDGTNLAFSPISIYLDLGLGARASTGKTQEQILNALNVDFETLNSSYKTLFCLLNDEYDEGKILTTNSVWLAQNENLEFNEDTLKDLANDYYCYSYSADFANDNANANKAITNFIKEKTNGLLAPELNLANETFGSMKQNPNQSQVENSGAKCPKCGSNVAVGAKFCPNCGNRLVETCPKCGHEIVHGAKFCPNCGNKLTNSCPKCGSDLEPGAKFCPNCGEKVA